MRRREPAMATDDRAVSEIVGFVLVFALVMGTITAVYVGGMGSLNDTRDAERVANTERAFDVLANNFQQLGRGEAPRRATEIKLTDADLLLQERHALIVNVSGTPSVTSSRPLTYDSGTGTTITYEHGAVIRVDQNGGAAMIREPDFLFTEDRAVIRNIELRGGQQKTGGSKTVLVRAAGNPPQLVYPSPGNDSSLDAQANISLQTKPDRTEAWVRYLEERPSVSECGTETTNGRTEITCGLDVEKLTVARIRVNVELT